MMKYIFVPSFLIFFAMLSSNCHASSKNSNIEIPSIRVSMESELNLTSDSMIYNHNDRVTEFFGNVVLKYGLLVLTTEKLKVSQKDSDNSKQEVEIFAKGKVIITTENQKISGDTAYFNKSNQLIIIRDNVKISQDGNKIAGNELILNLKTGIAEIIRPTTTILLPGDS